MQRYVYNLRSSADDTHVAPTFCLYSRNCGHFENMYGYEYVNAAQPHFTSKIQTRVLLSYSFACIRVHSRFKNSLDKMCRLHSKSDIDIDFENEHVNAGTHYSPRDYSLREAHGSPLAAYTIRLLLFVLTCRVDKRNA